MHMLIGCPAAPPCDVFISVMDWIRDYEKEKNLIKIICTGSALQE